MGEGPFDEVIIIGWSFWPQTKVTTRATSPKIWVLFGEEEFEDSNEFLQDSLEVNWVVESITQTVF